MKIDLHLHSFASIANGDAIKWESVNATVSKLYKSGVRLASFTDHNVFDVDLYLKCYELGKTGGLIFLPGIEANVVRKNGVIANLIYIFSEKLTKDELLKISKITNSIPKRGITIETANKIFDEFDVLKIPHIGKSDHFKSEDLEYLKFDAFEITSFSNKNYLKVLKDGFVSSVVSFSDTHIWTSYPQQKMLITEMDLNPINYNSLKEALKQNKVFSKEAMND